MGLSVPVERHPRGARAASRHSCCGTVPRCRSAHTAYSFLAASPIRSREVGTTGYATKQERVKIAGLDDLLIRSLLDRSQFDDPHGDAERLGISSAVWPLFGVLWPSGVHLAARLGQRPVSATERILEVGCGLALASLVGHRRGADVTASDRHPLAETFLRENLCANQLEPLKYRHGNWATPCDGAVVVPVVTGLYDLIVGSDLLYERDASASLARFIACHASPTAEIWIVDPDRCNRSAFNRHMRVEGFACQEERLRTPATPGVDAYKGRMLTYTRARGT